MIVAGRVTKKYDLMKEFTAKQEIVGLYTHSHCHPFFIFRCIIYILK